MKHLTYQQQNTRSSQVHKEHFLGQIMLDHKTRLNKFKKTEIIQSIFCREDGMKLKINSRGKKTWKIPKYVKT